MLIELALSFPGTHLESLTGCSCVHFARKLLVDWNDDIDEEANQRLLLLICLFYTPWPKWMVLLSVHKTNVGISSAWHFLLIYLVQNLLGFLSVIQSECSVYDLTFLLRSVCAPRRQGFYHPNPRNQNSLFREPTNNHCILTGVLNASLI
jgi:hypothetical protein